MKFVHSYTNPELDKNIIYFENNNRSGIYRWTNKINNKCYVGSSINLTKRLRYYYSLKFLQKTLLKEKSLIYSAILKYGYSNFSLDILEYCNIENLIEREQYYINNLKPKYNICKIANSRLGTKQSIETKKLMSLKSRGKNNGNFGKKAKEETIKKITKNFINKNISNETKLKLSLRNQGINVKLFDCSNNFINEFPNMRSAAKYLGITVDTIRKIYETGISYDEYIYKFELKDLRIWIYNSDYILVEIIENARKTSLKYNIAPSTLSNYIKEGKLYNKMYYFVNKNSLLNDKFNSPNILKSIL